MNPFDELTYQEAREIRHYDPPKGVYFLGPPAHLSAPDGDPQLVADADVVAYGIYHQCGDAKVFFAVRTKDGKEYGIQAQQQDPAIGKLIAKIRKHIPYPYRPRDVGDTMFSWVDAQQIREAILAPKPKPVRVKKDYTPWVVLVEDSRPPKDPANSHWSLSLALGNHAYSSGSIPVEQTPEGSFVFNAPVLVRRGWFPMQELSEQELGELIRDQILEGSKVHPYFESFSETVREAKIPKKYRNLIFDSPWQILYK